MYVRQSSKRNGQSPPAVSPLTVKIRYHLILITIRQSAIKLVPVCYFKPIVDILGIQHHSHSYVLAFWCIEIFEPCFG